MNKTYEVQVIEHEDQKPVGFWQSLKGKAVAVGAGVTALAVSAVSHAALDFGTAKTEILADIDSAEDFGVEIGLAILGFIAVVAVLRHVRGAVK